jgi:hypothetical protein
VRVGLATERKTNSFRMITQVFDRLPSLQPREWA